MEYDENINSNDNTSKNNCNICQIKNGEII